MATQTAFAAQYHALTGAVRRWEARRRTTLFLRWLPRLLAAGLAVGAGAGLLSRLTPLLLPAEIAALTGIAVLIALIAGAVGVWRTGRGGAVVQARRFDVLFGLDERLSTALELIEGRIRSIDELTGRQIDDAASILSRIDARSRLPLTADRRDWLIALLLALAVALLILLPNPQADAVIRDGAARDALDDAAETLRDLTQQIAVDPLLSDADRRELLQALQAAVNTLDRANISPEEAFAAVSSAADALRERADAQTRSAQAQQQALANTAAALRQMMDGMEGVGQSGAAMSASELLSQMAQQMANMTPEQMEQAANALQAGAQALQPIDPAAAQAMQQAAQAMQQMQQQSGQSMAQAMQGAQSAAQNALQNAQQQTQRAENAAQQAQNNAQAAQNQAQRAQSAADQIGGQPSQQRQSGQQGQSGQPQSGQQSQSGQQQSGQNSPAESGSQSGAQSQQQGQQGQQSQNGQPGAQGQQGQQGEQADGSQPAAGMQGQSGMEDDLRSGLGSSGSGAGDEPGSAGADTPMQGTMTDGGQLQASNNPDGRGQGDFEPVYALRRIGGEPGDTSIELESNPDGLPMTEGEFASNPVGQSLVPYAEVFGDYRGAANRALDSGYVPLGLRDVVREYFTSLEPRGRGE
jgi:hypothetical protein